MSDPPAAVSRPRHPPQMSLGFMLLMMVIFAMLSAALLYASRVPAIQDELQALFGGQTAVTHEDVGHTAHLTFIVFTLVSPLLLAGILSTGLSILRWRARQNEPRL